MGGPWLGEKPVWIWEWAVGMETGRRAGWGRDDFPDNMSEHRLLPGTGRPGEAFWGECEVSWPCRVQVVLMALEVLEAVATALGRRDKARNG